MLKPSWPGGPSGSESIVGCNFYYSIKILSNNDAYEICGLNDAIGVIAVGEFGNVRSTHECNTGLNTFEQYIKTVDKLDSND
jgi:hypothetical protein